MSDESYKDLIRNRILKRFEFWLVVAAVVVATVLLGLGGCDPEKPEKPVGPPEPANTREYRLTTRFGRVESLRVLEFLDSSGRLCVAVVVGGTSSQRPVGIDCTSLPPIAIERLPR